MAKKKTTWFYDTLCHRCMKLNGWVLTPNEEQGAEAKEIVNNHKAYSSEFPFDLRYCEHCKMETRQERVGWKEIPLR